MSFSITNTSESAVITSIATPSSKTGELTVTTGSLPLFTGDVVEGTNTTIDNGGGFPGGTIQLFLQQGDAKIDTYFNGTLYSSDKYSSGIAPILTPIIQSGDSFNMAISDADSTCFNTESFNTINFGTVELMIEQPDGKILVAGYFTQYGADTSIRRIQRFNSDLSLDTTFDSGTATNGDIYAMDLQSDGKIVIGGAFITYQGVPRRRIARLNTDGSLDTTFNIGTGFSASVWAIAVQEDDKILCGGEFLNYSGQARTRFARLNSDGSLDSSINTNVNDIIYQIKLQDDGKIVIGGDFTEVSATTQNRISRLNSNGTIDNTFTIGTGFNNGVYSVDIDDDGKIIVGGAFTQYSGQSRSRIARLNTNGSSDTSFNIGSGFTNGYVFSVGIFNDKYVVAGNFSGYSGNAVGGFLRINNDGSFDSTFNVGTGFDIDWNATFSSPILVLSNGNTAVTSVFTEYNGTSTPNFVAINPYGYLLNCE